VKIGVPESAEEIKYPLTILLRPDVFSNKEIAIAPISFLIPLEKLPVTIPLLLTNMLES
jgi:hypothetical protein